ncbi:MAG: hypothetical protein IKK68_05025 [Paludibacteraceae bacterium]|nr:hypothetical protein [Paludibacteraceae bacterium]
MYFKLTFIFCCFFSLFFEPSVAQKKSGNFVVITFTSDIDRTCGIQSYNWIVDSDSLNNRDIYLYPLHLDVLDTLSYNYCVEQNAALFCNESFQSLDWEQSYIDKQRSFSSLIFKKRKQIMEMNVVCANGRKENVIIYATPIVGSFETCRECCDSLGYPFGNMIIYIMKKDEDVTYDKSFFKKKEDIEKFMIRFNFIDFRRTFETYSGRVAKIKE